MPTESRASCRRRRLRSRPARTIARCPRSTGCSRGFGSAPDAARGQSSRRPPPSTRRAAGADSGRHRPCGDRSRADASLPQTPPSRSAAPTPPAGGACRRRAQRRSRRSKSPTRAARSVGWPWAHPSAGTARLCSPVSAWTADTSIGRFFSCDSVCELDEDLDLRFALDLLDELLEFLLALALHQEVLDLAGNFRQRRGTWSALFVNLDDVKTERRLDDRTDAASFQLERRILELRVHLSLREEAEVAAVRGAGLILRLRSGDLREVGAALDLLQRRLRPALRFGLLRRRRVLRNGKEDVARVHAFALLEAVEILLVESTHVRILHGDLGIDFGVDHFCDFEAGARLRAQVFRRQALRGDALRERIFSREAFLDVGKPCLDVAVNDGNLACARFLREQVISDELIEHPAKDLVALLRWNGAAGTLLDALHGVIELPALNRFAVDARDDRWNFGGHRFDGGRRSRRSRCRGRAGNGRGRRRRRRGRR